MLFCHEIKTFKIFLFSDGKSADFTPKVIDVEAMVRKEEKEEQKKSKAVKVITTLFYKLIYFLVSIVMFLLAIALAFHYSIVV